MRQGLPQSPPAFASWEKSMDYETSKVRLGQGVAREPGHKTSFPCPPGHLSEKQRAL